MRITALTITNVRAIEHLELTALPETGVIVIHGDNEQGKSTIMDALNAVLNFKYKSAAAAVKALQPVHRAEAPEVTAALTIGPVELTIRKRWLRGKKAELTVHAPQRSNHTDDEAEQKLEEILAEHLDTRLLETLFLRQDDLGAGVAAAGIPTLEQALVASQGGEIIDTTEDEGLLAAVEKEYQRFFTGTGKENKALANARRDRERAAEALAGAEQKLTQLQSHVDQVDRHEHTRARDEADLPEARAQVSAAESTLTAARQAEAAAEVTAVELERATHELEVAQREVEERAALAEEVAELAAVQTALDSELSTAQEKAAEEKLRVDELAAELETAKQERNRAAENAKEARRTVRILDDLTARDQLRELVAQLDTLDDNITAVRARRVGLRITDDDVRAVEDAARDLEVARRVRDLAVPHLELSAEPETDVTVDGDQVVVGEEPVRVDVREGTELRIGVVTARYRAGESGDDSAEETVTRAEGVLADLLNGLDCEDVAEVRARRDEANETAATLQRLENERAAVLAGRDADTVRARATSLTTELEGTDHPGLDPEAAAAEVAAAERARDTADAEAERLDAALAPWREGQAGRELIRVAAHHDNAAERARTAAVKLAAQTEKNPADALEEAVAVATRRLTEATEKQRQAAAAVAEADPEGKQADLDATTARVDSLTTRIHQATTELARLDGYIGQAAGAAEDVEKARAADEALRRQLENLERQAAAAQRLRSVLRRHQEEARSRYAQPFVDELTRLSRTVFGPSVAFDLTENLTVRDRTVDGATVPLTALSGGAKEQLAILTRFAIASLVARESEGDAVGVPVVVDDALGSTDPDRLQRMGQLFSQLGRSSQVIVLTCFPQRYDWVQPKTEYAISQLKSAGG